MEKRDLTTIELAALWRYTTDTIKNFRQAGLLIEDNVGHKPHRYLYSSIDALHASSLNNGRKDPAHTIPTTAELLAYTQETGEPALLTVTEAEDVLGVNRLTLYDLAKSGVILGFQLFGLATWEWRYPAKPLKDYARLRGIGQFASPPKGVSIEQVQKIIGLSRPTVFNLCNGASPQMLRMIDPSHPGRFIVCQKTLLNYLRQNLSQKPDGTLCMTPEEWCRMRFLHNDELVRIRRFRERSHTYKITVREAIENGTLPCLWGQGRREARIPEHIFYAWL